MSLAQLGHKDPLAPQDLRVWRALMAQPGHRDRQAQPARQALLEVLELLVRKDHKVLRALQVRPALLVQPDQRDQLE